MAVPADVTDLGAMAGAVERVLDQFGRLDIVVANAGISPRRAPVLEYARQEWHQVLDINLSGVWNTAKASVPALLSSGAAR